jgi:hypothetical protein
MGCHAQGCQHLMVCSVDVRTEHTSHVYILRCDIQGRAALLIPLVDVCSIQCARSGCSHVPQAKGIVSVLFASVVRV